MEEKYSRLKQIVEKELMEASPAHDMNHVMRVYYLCIHLAKYESNLDLDVLKTAALLHDIARVKESQEVDHAVLGAAMSEKILKGLGYPEEKIERVKHCVAAHRFRGEIRPKTIEAKILFDADKLDVLGAIGVARAFIIAGEAGEKIYSDLPVDQYVRVNLVGGNPNGRIKDLSKHAPNLEFETKFKHIPDILHTQKAKEIGRQRLEYMKRFFETLRREIHGAEKYSSN